MPFMAKCRNCGYITWANTKRFLKVLMRWHDSDSHKAYDSEDFDFCTWVITKISWDTYSQVSVASKNSAFWKAIRTRL